jgi:N-carbamoyl-L-amino-acid hydrolase
MSMADKVPTVDADRLFATLDGINRFGFDPATGGYDRPAFSAADMAVRRWFMDEMAAEGLAVHMDAAGNVFGRTGPDGPSVMVGSHLDTVPSGGAFDGALGCAAALECARALREAGAGLARPLEVVATADEEGRFGGMLGSQAIAGVVPDGFVETATDADGLRLADAMRAAGLDPGAVPGAARAPGSVAAFLELHIEQGPVLETAGRDVGIVTAVSGCTVLAVTLHGAANHSGTTPMDMRQDALVGLCRIGAALPALAREAGTDQSRLTVGHVMLTPNAPHTIPGAAFFTIVIRDVDGAVMRTLRAEVEALVGRACASEGLSFSIAERSSLGPVVLDAGLQDLLLRVGVRQGLEPLSMPSGAGHDAQTMAHLCPSALVFVPSRGGLSHAPQEHTGRDAIISGTAVLLDAVRALVISAP